MGYKTCAICGRKVLALTAFLREAWSLTKEDAVSVCEEFPDNT
jgi:hypothetical protein